MSSPQTQEFKELMKKEKKLTRILKAKNKAWEEYIQNPHYCENCKKVIPIPFGKKLSTIKHIKCCSKSCAMELRWQKGTVNIGEERSYEKKKGEMTANEIRIFAKLFFKKLKIDRCQNCLYHKHIEVCHIKPVRDFPPETLLSEINRAENLIGLCPNCHWEFDHGHLSLEEIQTKINQ